MLRKESGGSPLETDLKLALKSIFTLFFYFALTKTSHNNFWLEERSGDGSKNCVRMHGLYQNNWNFRVCVIACWGRVCATTPRDSAETERIWPTMGTMKKIPYSVVFPHPQLGAKILLSEGNRIPNHGLRRSSIFALPTTTWANLAFSWGNQISNQRLGRASIRQYFPTNHNLN